MAKTLMKALRTEMTADLPALAALLQSKGRGKDTVLAHITPKEAALLRERGGRGSKNPETGLLEFENEFDSFDTGFSSSFAPAGATVSQSPDMVFTSAGGAPELPQAGPITDTLPAQQYIPQTTPDLQLQPPAAAPAAAPTFGEASAMPGYSTGYPGITQPPTRFAETQPDFPTPAAAISAGLPASAAPVPAAISTPAATAPTKQPKSFLESLGLSGTQALGGTVLGGLGAVQARNAAAQGQQAKQELTAQAAPYQQQGRQLVSAAQSGQLSPASAQAYQAAQARAAQAAQASGGGVGVVQSQVALEQFRQQLLANDLNIGLQIQSIGDKIAQGAIAAGVQADQYVNSLTSNYAMNIGRVLMGALPASMTQPGATA